MKGKKPNKKTMVGLLTAVIAMLTAIVAVLNQGSVG